MFSTGHLIFLIVSLAVIVTGTILSKRYVPDINLMLKICLVIGIVSEVIKMFSVQLLFITIALLLKDAKNVTVCLQSCMQRRSSVEYWHSCFPV